MKLEGFIFAFRTRRYYPYFINRNATRFYSCTTTEWQYIYSKKLKDFILASLWTC